nr:serine/threonine-protein kinase ppk6 [Quercus suber]
MCSAAVGPDNLMQDAYPWYFVHPCFLACFRPSPKAEPITSGVSPTGVPYETPHHAQDCDPITKDLADEYLSFLEEVYAASLPPSSKAQQLPALSIPKNRSTSNLLYRSPSNSSQDAADGQRYGGGRLSVDGLTSQGAYDSLTRSPILTAERNTGLHRIRQHPPPVTTRQGSSSSPNLQPISPFPSAPPSRQASFSNLPVPASPSLPFGEDLTRFPSESLHSFSFTHQSSDSLHNRQNVLKRSIDFMRDKVSWAQTSPRIANAQARLTGDEELLSMMELLHRANMMEVPEHMTGTGLGIGHGPLTGPAYMTNDNVFDRSFMPDLPEQSESPTEANVPVTIMPDVFGKEHAPKTAISERTDTETHQNVSAEPKQMFFSSSLSPDDMTSRSPPQTDGNPLSRIDTTTAEQYLSDSASQRPQRSKLKRTYTDVAGYSLQQKLTEAMAQPYYTNQPASVISPTNPPVFTHQSLVRSGTLNERAPHGHRNQQAQAIFTTEAKAPWTITAANDLACLVFGVTRAEVRKLGIMEVIKEERRKWLEDKLLDPESGSSKQQQKQKTLQPPSSSQKSSPSNSFAGTGSGVTARLLSKPPARETYQSRRSKTENGVMMPPPPPPSAAMSSKGSATNHASNKSRGVLLCGDVVPIQKMNGSTGSASIWVKEKGNNLIFVVEEIAENVATVTVDEIGSVIRGSGDVEAIWGLERVRNGMDVQKLIPAFPKLAGTNTGAVDYDAIARLRRFTARTINSISIPITIDPQPEVDTFRISSFPHIAGIMVVNPATMRISSSNSVFSSALFGHENPDGMQIVELIPGFDNILRVMTDEDKIALVDGIVIPEHSFRRARSLLALREGPADAAAAFLRPSGLPARHRDGEEIMIDVQMRVVKSDREPIYTEVIIDEESPASFLGGELVYALWITYSRQMHATSHGVGPVTPFISRPGTPPQQPGPLADSGLTASPQINAESAEEDSRLNRLQHQLEAAKSASDGDDPSVGEPFEHPSPDMIETGVNVIKKKRIEDFAILEEMGQGAYGQVKLARYKKAAAKKMVIKYVTKRRILVDTWHRDRRLGTVPLEIHVLDYLRREGMQHPNIVEMADFFEDDINYYIEMVPHGLPGMDLFDYIELRVTMDEPECRKIFKQVAEAVRHLHVNAKVVHRDIKDENVILDGEGRVKLVDFGSAAYIKNGPFDVFVGTIDYAAPEVLRGLPYRGKEQDVWALGILLYTIVYKENPFYSIDEIMDHDLRVPYVLSEESIGLIRLMLDRDVERRIGIEAVLQHPWCQVVDVEKVESRD